eukprot:3686579-Pleurochrysis_carterae.AAC.3
MQREWERTGYLWEQVRCCKRRSVPHPVCLHPSEVCTLRVDETKSCEKNKHLRADEKGASVRTRRKNRSFN